MRNNCVIRFCEGTGLSAEASEDLKTGYRKILDDPFALAVWKRQIAAVGRGKPFDGRTLLERVGSLGERTGLHPEKLDLLFLIALLPKLGRMYEANDIPLTFLEAYSLNLRNAAESSFRRRSWCGTDIAWWFMDYYKLKLFTIGRLQFRKRRFKRDFETPNGSFHAGEYYLDVHIPGGEPLREDLCRDAYRRAAAFYRAHDGLEKIVFGCYSWLLSPVLRELLPAGSNILTFAGAYGLAAAEPQPGNPWTVFLFGHADPSRPEDFPEDSSLQRSVKRLLLEGREFPVGFGLMPFEE